MSTDHLRILGITLARSGSKRVQGKNTREILGKPLIQFTIDEAMKSTLLHDYIVSTDDAAIQKLVQNLGADAPFLRPRTLATDSATSVSALQHAVRWMEESKGVKYDFIVELMATNPLKTVEDIDACIRLLQESGADSVIAVHEVGDAHPARVKKIEDGRLVNFCVEEVLESRRQDLEPKAYIRSGSIYALSRKELMENGRRYGSDFSLPYILPGEKAVNIDNEIDFIVADAIMRGAR